MRFKQTVCPYQYPDASVGPGLFVQTVTATFGMWLTIFIVLIIRITNEETKLFHGIDERISIDNLVRVCIFMRNFIEQTDATFSQRKHAKSKYNSKHAIFCLGLLEALGLHIVV